MAQHPRLTGGEPPRPYSRNLPSVPTGGIRRSACGRFRSLRGPATTDIKHAQLRGWFDL